MDAERRERRRVVDSDEEDDFTPVHHPTRAPGTTVSCMPEDERKQLQDGLLAAMFKWAEEKYGRKRLTKEKSSAKEDFDLYLRSMRARVKTAGDRLAESLRKQADFQKKVNEVQKELDYQQEKLQKAEDEKVSAEAASREPELPRDFIVPQRAKKLGAGLGALVLKASKQDWSSQMSNFVSAKSKAKGAAPEWADKKRDKTATLLKVGK